MAYDATIEPLPELHREAMRGRSWHPAPRCPAFDELRLLRLPHRDFDGAVVRGELIVAAALADEVVEIFSLIFAANFPIERMRPIAAYAGDDEASMAANNSSGFNFRTVAGTELLSNHALGRAIDINPVQNPWLDRDRVTPAAGRAYLDRGDRRPGMLVAGDPVTTAFMTRGWRWGGAWPQPPDYHHFDKPPR